jgi:glycerol-3-phosphate dehydrogenase (NAD(P)+)
MKKDTVAILGAGSWGTAVAVHLAHCGHRVLLWGHDLSHIENMIKARSNPRYLPGVTFPATLEPCGDLTECLSQASIDVIAVPSHAFGELLQTLPQSLNNLSWLTKGLDPKTHCLLSELVFEKWGSNFPIAVISGPSFAREVAQHLPTAITVSGHQREHLEKIQNLLHHNNLRVYQTEDFIGVQICGAVKNVLAIACGVSDGLNYGANAKAALITRGLAEMTRLGMALGAQQETFMGLAGLGDLVLTCTDDQSRNRRFGLKLGQGIELKNAEQQIGQVVEGKHNAAQVCALATQHDIDMPICQVVHHLIQGNMAPKQAVLNLMNRPPKDESS